LSKASTLGDLNLTSVGRTASAPYNQEERGLSSGFCGGSPDGPQDGLEVV
jgi:hypothetical protein